ncbi:GNAT family N-acetyltransferase [Oceanobacillus sp. CFH 90083]|uniref:GNAT family N-acetyltransferase n=1 Tax=Oceanobacillus sp. CFH 90083 TaxID=2592336 RepID=UPI00128AFD7E|nr:GNAT family N-acetyltransferase [Oceanobacillus sp. CFH 90083]
MKIRAYTPADEKSWLQCRVLAFLETAYFDNVLQEKETYENPSIELVAEADGNIAGLIDIEYEVEERTVCSRGSDLGGMIWHIAVHPDYSRQGIGQALLNEAEKIAKVRNLNRFEAWTRDDKWVQNWYVKMGFTMVDSYYHIYFEEDEIKSHFQTTTEQLFPATAFAHYTGENPEQFAHTQRKHQCVCYIKELD